MRALLRWIILWALDRHEPEYDPAEFDRIRREAGGG